VLVDRLKTREDRDWYAARAAEEGWSRGVLEHQIKVNLRSAIGAAPSNFTQALMDRLQDTMLEFGRGWPSSVARSDSPSLTTGAARSTIVDDQYRRPEIHAPTVGILLCTGGDVNGAVLVFKSVPDLNAKLRAYIEGWN